MTLGDYTDIICSKVGQTDPTSVALCKKYCQQRYQMIYDRLAWRDSQVNAATNAVAGQSFIPLPANVDRVITMRYGGNHFLDPVESSFLIESDPTIFERSGTPIYYEEFTADDGSKQITLYPTPVANDPILIIGKRTLPPLVNNTDTPILRNIDNVIIAYATGDMLERQRQYAKSGAKFQEAASLFDDAMKLEQQQTNVPRRSKNLTVSGNSLAELTDDVAARCGDYTPATRILIQQFLRRNYQMIYDAYLWPESLCVVRVNSDGSQVVMPEYVGRVVSVRNNSSTFWELEPADLSLYFRISPQIFEQKTGPAVAFSILTPVGVSVLPPQREKLSIVSTSNADQGNVFVKGESAGIEVSETVVLNGTTPVQTVNVYDVPLTVSKLTTTSDVIVTGVTSLVQLERILAKEIERKHVRLWMQANSTASTCLALAKRKIRPLIQDEDTPLLSDIQSALIFGALANCFSKIGNAAAATEAKTQADAGLKTLIDLETQQSATQQRVIPYVEPAYDTDCCDK